MPPLTLVRLFLLGLTPGLAIGQARAQPPTGANTAGPPLYDRPPINYSNTKPQDAIARLARRVADGQAELWGSDQEILRAVLRELAIPVASQMTVFSRTSLQAPLIRPDNPRALYFSDSVYVAWVPGGRIEAAAIDPELGPVFYAFNPQDARERRRTFVRESSCLRCHGGAEAGGIPRLFARSIVPDRHGDLLVHNDPDIVEDDTSFEVRWGGWYVTGYTGRQRHWGNAFAAKEGGLIDFNPSDDRPAELSGYFDTSRYLTNTSDVVALMIFEHQLTMHNSLTRAAQRYRRAVAAPAKSAPAGDSVPDVLASAADDVVDHLLFRDAARMPPGVAGSDAFRQAFAADARRSRQGDALKDLSLRGRLFANRCSFLIYSDSFSALPGPLKIRILERLHAALQGDDARYAYLEKEEKRRILEILIETLPDAGPRFTR